MENEIKTAKIEDLIPDDKNFNKGTEKGQKLIENSFSQFGAGRSILIDKNNRIIAGNKSVENATIIGLEDVIIVETTGDKLVAVKRTDIDLDSKEGREMALADNATSKVNIEWDEEVLKEVAEEFDIVPDDWGLNIGNGESINLDSFFEENMDPKKEKFKITLEYTNEEYELVMEALSKHNGTKEQIIYKLLGL